MPQSSGKIHANGKTFANVDALWEAIQDCWDNIPQKIIKNLVKSMQKRMMSLLENGGKSIKYYSKRQNKPNKKNLFIRVCLKVLL